MFFGKDTSSSNTVDSPLNTVSGATPNTVPSIKDHYLFRSTDNIKNGDKSKEAKDRNSPLARDADLNVGFSDLPNQIHRKTIKKGFEFTIMVVGENII